MQLTSSDLKRLANELRSTADAIDEMASFSRDQERAFNYPDYSLTAMLAKEFLGST